MARSDKSTESFELGSPPGAWPGLGHTLSLVRQPLKFIASLPQHGDLVRVKIGPYPLHVACHPEIVRQLLMNPRTFDKGGPLFDTARALIGNGLGSCTWQDHQWQRPLLQPAFHTDRIEHYATAMVRSAQTLTEPWATGRRIDVTRAMNDITMNVLSSTLVPLDPEDQEKVKDALRVTLGTVQLRTMVPFSWWHRLPTPGNRRFATAQRTLRRITARVIDEHRKNPRSESNPVSLLLAGKDGRTGQPLTDEEIHDQIVTLFIGGTDTTASTLAFAFHLLGTHPECEARLHAEVDEVLGSRAPTVADLTRLGYTQRVITETLRMFPAGWFFTRTTTAPTQLGGHALGAGAAVAYSPYLLHRRPDLFPDPDRFDPDRWLPEHAKHTARGAVLPFGSGNRKCIGDNFAVTEAVLVLAAIASRWRLRPVPGAVIRPRPQLVLSPGPLPMTCEPRRRAAQDTPNSGGAR
ncbi:cytochrome P450 [Streptomyces sp. NPDC007369]|uniref:cytochrome P450 n=1 Tax=Streptomyces sp. NPDC007369 TaxID=3154589 RepID=UPI0033D455B5